MKLTSLKYLLFALPALGFTACDNIDADDRFIETEPVIPGRTVLLEDFTGQNCRNCPDAHKEIELIKEQHGDNVIAVSVHAGGFGISVNSTNFETDYVGLMQPEGDEYDSRYNTLQTWPAGTVNRGSTLNSDSWATAVRNALSTEAEIAIDIEAAPSADKSTIEITSTLRPSANLKGRYQLWMTEDNIVARQRDGSKLIRDYVHNHVFRGAINGTWGEEMTLTSGVHSTLSHSVALRNNEKERWDVNNLTVVAFFYDETGVLQAAKAKISDTTSPAE